MTQITVTYSEPLNQITIEFVDFNSTTTIFFTMDGMKMKSNLVFDILVRVESF